MEIDQAPIKEVISANDVSGVLRDVSKLRVAVVGDVAIDGYWHSDMTVASLSREAPRFSRKISQEHYVLGAGANVAMNLKALNVGHVAILSIVGNDWRSSILFELLSKFNIDFGKILIRDYFVTNAFIRPVLHGFGNAQEDSRLDFYSSQKVSVSDSELLRRSVGELLADFDALLIADQVQNGIVNDELIKILNNRKNSANTIVIADSRNRIREFKHMFLKPNRFELMRAFNQDVSKENWMGNHHTSRELAKLAGRLAKENKAKVITTLESHGCLYVSGEASECIRTIKRDRSDIAGSGDTFISALASALAVGQPLRKACAFGNLAASTALDSEFSTSVVEASKLMQNLAEM